MRRVRRTSPEIRIEMAPLIDVVFLLLTFFVFAMLLMVRAQVIDISLPSFSTGSAASETASVLVTVDARGEVAVDGEAVPRAALGRHVREKIDANPDAVIRVAADQGGQTGDLLAVIDLLSREGLGNFQLFGEPAREP